MTPEATRVRVIEVEPLDGYVLRVRFGDGSSREVDLAAELWGPVFEPLRDLELFRKVAVDPELRRLLPSTSSGLDMRSCCSSSSTAASGPEETPGLSRVGGSRGAAAGCGRV